MVEVKEMRSWGNAATNCHQSLVRESRAVQALLLCSNLEVNNFGWGAQFNHAAIWVSRPALNYGTCRLWLLSW